MVARLGCPPAARSTRRRSLRPSCAGTPRPVVTALRNLLAGPDILLGPCAHDGLSARLIERAGFSMCFMSGFSVSAARCGLPDAGLLSYAEVVDTGRSICAATSLPVVGDGDTGYGNAVNVKRTVLGFAQAGFAGILIEDQVQPKACGHTRVRAVVPRDEALARVRAACDARDAGADIVIFARSDSRAAVGLEEALWRARAFADAGADVVFVDALQSEAELEALCRAVPGIPKMANNLEGGRTPILTPAQLQSLGFKLVAFPLSLLAASLAAMEEALEFLRAGQVPPALPSFDYIKEAVGFDEYYEEEDRYAVK